MSATLKKNKEQIEEQPEEKTDKIIKVKPSGHTLIKVQAAEKGKSMGDYVVALARADKK